MTHAEEYFENVVTKKLENLLKEAYAKFECKSILPENPQDLPSNNLILFYDSNK
jgi:hypothetical protein